VADKRFSLFHLSLLPVEQLDFSTLDMTREEWLRHVFSRPMEITYRANESVHWVPKPNPASSVSIVGIIQKQRSHSLHRPPSEGGAEILEKEWQGAYSVIDPTDHEEGQRIAIENDVVGLPATLLRYLVDEVNRRDDRPYNIKFDPIFDGGSFWEFAEASGNILEWVRFDFTAPNMWGAKTELDRELRETRDETGAEKVKVEFRSQQGIKATAKKIQQGVEYAERGAGDISAKSLTGKRYSSKKKQRRSAVPPPLEETEDKAGYLARLWKTILGRRSDDVLAEEAKPMGITSDTKRDTSDS
jgi:hypothetical protein